MLRPSIALKMHTAKIVVIIWLAVSSLAAEQCRTVDASRQANITQYILKKYKIPAASDLVLSDNSIANEACFRKLTYRIGTTTREISLYLSPDQKYLSPVLYDVDTDPIAEERLHREELLKQVMSNGPPTLGPATATVTLVVFSDFQCPYCRRLADELEREILPGESEKIRLVFKNFPLGMHNWAEPAAKMAACASLQNPDSFWRIHDYLFKRQSELRADTLREQLDAFVDTDTRIDKAQFRSCVDKDLALGIVTKDVAVGKQLGVHATPTVFVNGVRMDGLRSAEELRSFINSATAESQRIANQNSAAQSEPNIPLPMPASDGRKEQ